MSLNVLAARLVSAVKASMAFIRRALVQWTTGLGRGAVISTSPMSSPARNGWRG